MRRGGRRHAPTGAVVRALGNVRHWELWSQPAGFVLAIGTLCILSVAAAITALLQDGASASNVARAAAILVLSAVFELVTARVDRLRRRLAPGPFVDMSSVWTFAAAIVLPPGLAI